jgi:hypothetical protein
MPGLSDIFNSGNDDSSNQDHNGATDTAGNLDSALGLDATNANSHEATDNDGSSSASSSDQTFGLNTSTDGLIHSLDQGMDSNDHASS